MKRLPLPISDWIWICPLSSRMRELTTSMPTPRPEMSVTSVLVENPGRKIRFRHSSVVRREAVSLSIRPFSRALERSRSGSMPAPSSRISMVT